jgi:hypothetical protein
MFYRIRLPGGMSAEETRAYADKKLSVFFAWCVKAVRDNLPDDQCEKNELALSMVARHGDYVDRFAGDCAFNGYLELCSAVAKDDRWKSLLVPQDVRWMEDSFIPENLEMIERYRDAHSKQ